MRNLVGAHESVIDGADDGGDAIGWIKALIGIHLAAQIGVGCDLPATQVNGLETGLGHLYGLVSSKGAQRRNVLLLMKQAPEFLRARTRQRVFHVDGAAKAAHVLVCIGAGNSVPPLGIALARR